jgi:uncharacterized membrane protein HdeD (DUF308 family)
MSLAGNRKFIVVMTALLLAGAIAFLAPPMHAAQILAAFGAIASVCVGAFMAAHAVADSKFGNGNVTSHD